MSDALRDPSLLRLTVLTPEQILYEGEALWAQVPLVDGLVGVWPGHAPLVGRIAPGIVEYATAEGIQTVAVGGGVLRVNEGRAIVLVSALAADDLSGWSDAGAEEGADEEDVDLEALVESVFSDEELRELQGD